MTQPTRIGTSNCDSPISTAEMHMELNLKDRVAFITGANRGIGAGIAKAFAAEGIHLGLFARNVAQCEEVAQQIRNSAQVRVHVQHIDFAQPDTLPPAVSRAVENL